MTEMTLEQALALNERLKEVPLHKATAVERESILAVSKISEEYIGALLPPSNVER